MLFRLILPMGLFALVLEALKELASGVAILRGLSVVTYERNRIWYN
jgi:hypothetical protein